MATVIVSSACRSKVPSQSALRALRWCGEDVEGVGGRVGGGAVGGGLALERAKLFADGHTELNAPDLF